ERSNPDRISLSVRTDVFGGLAAIDPVAALKRVDPARDAGLAFLIGKTPGTDRNRTLGLQAMRTRAAADPEAWRVFRIRYFNGLGAALGRSMVDPASAWIESAGLNAQERWDVIEGLQVDPEGGDPGGWIAWVHANAPSEESIRK